MLVPQRKMKMYKIRLDGPNGIRYIDSDELPDILMFEGRKYIRDQAQYEKWGSGTTYSLVRE